MCTSFDGNTEPSKEERPGSSNSSWPALRQGISSPKGRASVLHPAESCHTGSDNHLALPQRKERHELMKPLALVMCGMGDAVLSGAQPPPSRSLQWRSNSMVSFWQESAIGISIKSRSGSVCATSGSLTSRGRSSLPLCLALSFSAPSPGPAWEWHQGSREPSATSSSPGVQLSTRQSVSGHGIASEGGWGANDFPESYVSPVIWNGKWKHSLFWWSAPGSSLSERLSGWLRARRLLAENCCIKDLAGLYNEQLSSSTDYVPALQDLCLQLTVFEELQWNTMANVWRHLGMQLSSCQEQTYQLFLDIVLQLFRKSR